MSEPRFPIRDEITGEIVADPDGDPIGELSAADYLGLVDSLSIEELAAGERAWRFGHVIVDEAQDLTPMQWRMVARRARGHSMTIVGDIAQRSEGTAQRWAELLPPELGDVPRFDLTTNYRSPVEIATIANRVLGRIAPDLDPPIAIRSSGHDPEFVNTDDVRRELPDQIARARRDTEGRIAVIGVETAQRYAEDGTDGVVVHLTPRQSKGMEFDSVIVVEPADIVDDDGGLSLLYVALTRSTDRLTVLYSRPLPAVLAEVAT